MPTQYGLYGYRNNRLKVPEDNLGYMLEPPYPMEHMDRRYQFPITLKSDLRSGGKIKYDSYNHVNNGQYIKMAEAYLPDDFIVTKMRVEYKNRRCLACIYLRFLVLTTNTV